MGLARKGIVLLFSTIIVLSLVLGLVACAGTTTPTTPATSTPTTPVTPTTPASPTPTTPAATTIRWELASEWEASDPLYSVATARLIQQIKEKTNGRLIVTPHAPGTLVPQGKGLDAVQSGAVQWADTCGAYYTTRLPLAELSYGVPAVPLNAEQWADLWGNKGGIEMSRKAHMETLGVRMGALQVATPELIVFSKPFTDLASLKGRKIRISGGYKTKVVQDIMGLVPTLVMRGEVQTALMLGTLDGASTAIQSVSALKWHEAARYMMTKPYVLQAGHTEHLINAQAYDALPADIKKVLDGVLDEHFWWSVREFVPVEMKRSFDEFAKFGVKYIELPEKDYRDIVKLSVPVWDEMAAKDAKYAAPMITLIKQKSKELGYIQ